MLSPLRLIFFGSFGNYSAQVLEHLLATPHLHLVGVVTTPAASPRPGKPPVPNEVESLARKSGISVYTPPLLDDAALTALPESDLWLTAGYGKLIPAKWLSHPKLVALNLHFSLLPAYRGANPGEWALLAGEATFGVTLIEMAAEFDTGGIVSQAQLEIAKDETRETLYTRLYELGGQHLKEILPQYATGRLPTTPQPHLSPTPYATRFRREDGFVAWEAWAAALRGQDSELHHLSPLLQKIATWIKLQHITPRYLERVVRALSGYPSAWTEVLTQKGQERLKILRAHMEGSKLVIDRAQLAGQQAKDWEQLKSLL
jgi:methionyl-tRNA formyltransferase